MENFLYLNIVFASSLFILTHGSSLGTPCDLSCVPHPASKPRGIRASSHVQNPSPLLTKSTGLSSSLFSPHQLYLHIVRDKKVVFL